MVGFRTNEYSADRSRKRPMSFPDERFLRKPDVQPPAVSDRMEEGRSEAAGFLSSPTSRPSFPTSSENPVPRTSPPHAATRQAGTQVPGTPSTAPPGVGPRIGRASETTRIRRSAGAGENRRPAAERTFLISVPTPGYAQLCPQRGCDRRLASTLTIGPCRRSRSGAHGVVRAVVVVVANVVQERRATSKASSGLIR